MTEEEARQIDIARYKDPLFAYQFLQRAMFMQREECGDEFPVIPLIGLLNVVHVDLKEKYRDRELEIWAQAVRIDGRLDVLEYSESSSSPDFSGGDQGHFDFSIRWRNLDDDGIPIKWSHLYTADPMLPNNVTDHFDARRSKMTALYHVLKNTVRVRLLNHELQYNEKQKTQVYQRLGSVLMGLSEKNPVWNSHDLKK